MAVMTKKINSNTFKTMVQGNFEFVQDGTGKPVDITNQAAMFDFEKYGNTILEANKKLDSVEDKFGEWDKNIDGYLDKITSPLDMLHNIVDGIASLVESILNGAISLISDPFGTIMNFLEKTALGKLIKKFIEKVLAIVKLPFALLSKIYKKVMAIIASVLSFGGKLLDLFSLKKHIKGKANKGEFGPELVKKATITAILDEHVNKSPEEFDRVINSLVKEYGYTTTYGALRHYLRKNPNAPKHYYTKYNKMPGEYHNEENTRRYFIYMGRINNRRDWDDVSIDDLDSLDLSNLSGLDRTNIAYSDSILGSLFSNRPMSYKSFTQYRDELANNKKGLSSSEQLRLVGVFNKSGFKEQGNPDWSDIMKDLYERGLLDKSGIDGLPNGSIDNILNDVGLYGTFNKSGISETNTGPYVTEKRVLHKYNTFKRRGLFELHKVPRIITEKCLSPVGKLDKIPNPDIDQINMVTEPKVKITYNTDNHIGVKFPNVIV